MHDNWANRLRDLLRIKIRTLKNFTPSARYDTSDVVQEAFLQIYRDYGDQHENREFPNALLKKIAIGHLAKQHRFHNSEKRSTRKEERIASSEIPSNGNAPETSVELRELTDLVLESISKLDPLEQQIVIGRLIQERTVRDLTRQLSITAPVFNRIFKQACRKIKADFQC